MAKKPRLSLMACSVFSISLGGVTKPFGHPTATVKPSLGLSVRVVRAW